MPSLPSPRCRAFTLLTLLTCTTTLAAGAQDTPTPPAPVPAPVTQEDDQDLVPLQDTIITATRSVHDVFDLPRSVIIEDSEGIRRRNESVGLDSLSERIGIWVEKRNGASSDPVMRGFSGGNILALVDGDSLTTFWGEGGYAGDDMYAKVDAQSLERIEVVRGPASVLYGTSAIGGVINFITRRPPIDYTSGGYAGGGEFRTSVWGATNGVLLRGDVYGATPGFKYRLGYSMYDIGDTRGGGDLGLLVPSGVEQSNVDWNSEVRLGPKDFLEFNVQSTNTDGLSKYYRPTQRNFNDRNAATLRWNSFDTALGDSSRVGLYIQDKHDERVWLDQDKQGIAEWQTLSADWQTVTPMGDAHFLTWGLSASHQVGESPDDEQFTITTPATGTQKASPDSTWDNIGVFAQDEWMLSDKWSLTGSMRFDTFQFEADDNEFWTNPGSTSPENTVQTAPGTYDDTTWTGGLGLVRNLDPDWMTYGSWSRGYRLFPPGFGLRQTGYGVLAPTDGFLAPMTADQFELGTRVERDWWRVGVAAYYSFLSDVQQPVPGSWNGLTEIDYDQNGTIDPDEQIYNVTGADGYVTGLEITSSIDLDRFWSQAENWSWSNGFMANYGRVEFDDGEEPLRHTHPPRWLTALHWEDPNPQGGAWFEIVGDFVARFDQISEGRLNSDVGYLNDPQDPNSGLIRPYGLPSYIVAHIRGGVNLSRNTRLTVGINNIFDEEYRVAHSRMDAAGRSVNIGLRASF